MIVTQKGAARQRIRARVSPFFAEETRGHRHDMNERAHGSERHLVAEHIGGTGEFCGAVGRPAAASHFNLRIIPVNIRTPTPVLRRRSSHSAQGLSGSRGIRSQGGPLQQTIASS